MPLSNRAKAYIIGKVRLAWRFYDEARKDCLTTKKCVKCQKPGKLYADHIKPVGSFLLDENKYVERMLCERSNLQAICETCHKAKTQIERKNR